MLHVDIPSPAEISALSRTRTEGCVSVYLKTTPLTQHVGESIIEFRNLAGQAVEQLGAARFDKNGLSALSEHFDDLADDEDFWRLQANSLALFATPDRFRLYRLGNVLTSTVQVSDRFHIKPLLRAVTFSHTAFILALAENTVKLIEISPDLPPAAIKVDDLPKSAASAVGTANVNSRSPSGRIQGSEGQNVRLRQYARRVDAALRPVLSGRDIPLILAATGRLEPLFRSVNSYSELLDDSISDSPDSMSDSDLAAAARPVLDKHYDRVLRQIASEYQEKFSRGLATADISDAARAATYGAAGTILVNIDSVVPGRIADDTGAVEFADAQGADNYDITDEIARRALAHGGRVLAVRRSDLPAGEDLAAILRYPV
jgi:hypothetical protein